MIQFGSQVIVTNAFEKYYLGGNKALRLELENLANPKDGHRDRLVLLDAPANLSKPPNIFQRFFAWLGLIKLPPFHGSLKLIEGGKTVTSTLTPNWLWNSALTVKESFPFLKKHCQIFLGDYK
jgi:hypothetical protein